MPIILLISDFQDDSFQAGVLKYNLCTSIKDLDFIDISHRIRLNNTIEAAFVCKQIQLSDNQSSILITKVGFSPELIVYQHLKHLYIFPNNGLISMVFEEVNKAQLKIVEAGKEVQVIQAFLDGKFDLIESTHSKLIVKHNKIPLIQSNIAVAECIFTDGNGNCYFNINEKTIRDFVQEKPFQIRIQHYTGQVFNTIGTHVHEVGQGEAIFTFSSTGYLKLQINLGNAKQLFRIKDDTKIIIETL